MTTLAAALVKAQQEMPPVDKDSRNPHFGNSFASLDNIVAKTRPVLNKHGLAIVQFPTVSELGQPCLRTILVHSESGEQLQADMPLLVGKQDMQGLGSAITYARRYAWAAALGIASDEDDDGHHASQQAAPQRNQTRPAASGTISEAQAKRLFAIAKSKGVPQERVKQLTRQVAGVDSSAEVPKARYDELVAAVEAAGATCAECGAAGEAHLETCSMSVPF